MPTFKYVARSQAGKKTSGTMRADSRQALVLTLQTQGLIPDRITESGSTIKTPKINRGPRVKAQELVIFTRQLSTIVNAGLPLLQGLEILSEQTEDMRFAAVMRQIAQDVEGGETFSEALKRHPRIFTELYTAMVRAGEASGTLDNVLTQLAEYLEATEELKRRIRAAMTYPVVAFSMIILIAAGLIIWVVPQFGEIFASFGAKLPVPTRILLAVSDILRSWFSLLVILGFGAIVMGIKSYGATASGRYNLDAAKLRLPVFGKLLRKVAISRFTRTLSTLTRSGVAILAALEIVERTCGNEVFGKAIAEAGNCVRNGETLAEPLSRSGHFPAMVTRMIGVGEKTGALEQMLEKIADFYDSEVKSAVDSLTSMIEPILILMMGIVVGGIVIALFLPILMLSSLIQ